MSGKRCCWANITLCFIKHNNTLNKIDSLILKSPRSWSTQRPDNVAYSVWVFVPHTEGTSLLLVLLVPDIPCRVTLPPAFPGVASFPAAVAFSLGEPSSLPLTRELHTQDNGQPSLDSWSHRTYIRWGSHLPYLAAGIENLELLRYLKILKKIFRRGVFSYIYRYFLRNPLGG